jgi:hypothetical protein
MVQVCNPSTWEAETRELSLRPAWATKQNSVSKKKNTHNESSVDSKPVKFGTLRKHR